jgi:hypothetical protein
MKSTHSGTCQICGSLQALPSKVLSKHGYTVDHGYFNGVCCGERHQPLELDRTFADQIAAELLVNARNHDKDAEAVLDGFILPSRAWNGEYRKFIPEGKRFARTERVMVAYAEAPAEHQREAVRDLRLNLLNRAILARNTSKAITTNADRVHGKQQLQERSEESKRVIVPGTVVHLYGKDGYDVTVLRVEERVVRSFGPHLNGKYVPHIVFERNGKEYGYPVRLIRQASIQA